MIVGLRGVFWFLGGLVLLASFGCVEVGSGGTLSGVVVSDTLFPLIPVPQGAGSGWTHIGGYGSVVIKTETGLVGLEIWDGRRVHAETVILLLKPGVKVEVRGAKGKSFYKTTPDGIRIVGGDDVETKEPEG